MWNIWFQRWSSFPLVHINLKTEKKDARKPSFTSDSWKVIKILGLNNITLDSKITATVKLKVIISLKIYERNGVLSYKMQLWKDCSRFSTFGFKDSIHNDFK